MSSGTVAEDTPVVDTGFVCVLCLKVFDRSQLPPPNVFLYPNLPPTSSLTISPKFYQTIYSSDTDVVVRRLIEPQRGKHARPASEPNQSVASLIRAVSAV